MWATLLGLLPGAFNTITSITGAISNEKINAQNAKTEQDRIAAQERAKSLELQRDVLIEDARHSKLDIWVRTIIASGPAFILCKIFFYDKGLGWGTTEIANTDYLWNVIMVVLGFYFVSSVASMFRR
jgi:hypothetical protein